mmetsp:Transcript_116164/g.328677  ORF Transcript_116164/g.328677 Transcript_116164/m.328677 type:complete len:129 (+) Transcript_116164:97-483(+)
MQLLRMSGTLKSGISPMTFTPMGVLPSLLSPPILYIWLALFGLCILSALVSACWPALEPYVYAILDFMAMIVRTFVAIGKAIFMATQVIFYPIKECGLGTVDGLDSCLHPYKVKKPYTDIPTFRAFET